MKLISKYSIVIAMDLKLYDFNELDSVNVISYFNRTLFHKITTR